MSQSAEFRDAPGGWTAPLIAFLCGAGVLALEITGARVFTPWFGASIVVWTNVIGVTLGAVAIGNLCGSRVADRASSARWLTGALALAGVLAACVPYETPWLATRYLPPGLPLDTAFALIDRASLLVAICTLGPPLILLGAATPILIRRAASSGGVGRAAGIISGAATAGSLLGTWLPVHVLIPRFGSRATCIIAGATIVLAAVIAARAATRGRFGWVLACVPILLLVLASVAGKQVGRNSDLKVLAEIESRYQYARVEDDGQAVMLRLNEGLDSFHSLTIKGQTLTGQYYDCYGLYVPLAARDGRVRVLVLGFAAGTIARQILALYGDDFDVHITGVEIDPRVAALGEQYFELPRDTRLELVGDQDARIFLRCSDRRFDYIIVDTYASQVYVPFQLCSTEFFALARQHLTDSGILAANLSGYTLEDEPLRAIRNTAAAVYDEVSMVRVPRGRNFVLAVSEHGAPPDIGQVGVPGILRPLRDEIAAAGQFRYRFDASERILTDDHSPIELLYDRDLLRKARSQLAAGALR